MARLTTLFAAVAALAVAPVQAAGFATASLSDLRITLFDLKPSDGITPSITFDLRANNASVFAENNANTRFRSRESWGEGKMQLEGAAGGESRSGSRLFFAPHVCDGGGGEVCTLGKSFWGEQPWCP